MNFFKNFLLTYQFHFRVEEDLTLLRFRYGKISTQGMLYWKGDFMDLYTIELPWKNNEIQVSCIPEGVYPVKKRPGEESKNFPYLHLHVQDVPNRSWILFHIANKPSDLLGCIGPGLSSTRNFVGHSQNGLNKMLEMVPDEFTMRVLSVKIR